MNIFRHLCCPERERPYSKRCTIQDVSVMSQKLINEFYKEEGQVQKGIVDGENNLKRKFDSDGPFIFHYPNASKSPVICTGYAGRNLEYYDPHTLMRGVIDEGALLSANFGNVDCYTYDDSKNNEIDQKQACIDILQSYADSGGHFRNKHHVQMVRDFIGSVDSSLWTLDEIITRIEGSLRIPAEATNGALKRSLDACLLLKMERDSLLEEEQSRECEI